MSEDSSLAELPGAVADYAAGVGDAVVRGGTLIAVPLALVGLLAAVVGGGGVALIALAVVGPAVAVGVGRELPPRLDDLFR